MVERLAPSSLKSTSAIELTIVYGKPSAKYVDATHTCGLVSFEPFVRSSVTDGL